MAVIARSTLRTAAYGLLAQLLLFGFVERRSVDAQIAGGQEKRGREAQAGARAGDQCNGFIVSHSAVSPSFTPRRAASFDCMSRTTRRFKP